MQRITCGEEDHEEATDEDRQERLSKMNQDDSPLLRLAAELRNRIYRYALYQGTVDVYAKPVKKKKKDFPVHKADLALLSTCKQIRAEAQMIFFSVNTFEYQMNALGEHGFQTLVPVKAREQVKSVKMRWFHFKYICSWMAYCLPGIEEVVLVSPPSSWPCMCPMPYDLPQIEECAKSLGLSLKYEGCCCPKGNPTSCLRPCLGKAT